MSSGVSAPVSPLTRYEARRPDRCARRVQEHPRRIQTERGGHRLGRHMPGGRQAPGRRVDGEPGDAVVATVADIEEPARWRQIDLRTGIAYGHTFGQRGDRFHGGESAGSAIDAVGRHAAPLLVGEIGEIERGMEAIVPRPDRPGRVERERRVGAQPSGGRVEPKLRDEIRAGDVLRRLQDVVVLPGDMRHEGEAVRRVGQDRVGSRRSVLPVERRPADRTVASERMHGRVPALVVRRQEVCAGAVGGEIRRRMLGRDAPQRCQRTAGRVDTTAFDGRRTSIADIEHAPVRAYREG